MARRNSREDAPRCARLLSVDALGTPSEYCWRAEGAPRTVPAASPWQRCPDDRQGAPMTDPTIPDSAFTALFRYAEGGPTATAETAIRAIGDAIAAAKLRELALELSRDTQIDHVPSVGEAGYLTGLDTAARMATQRADQLAPPETDAADELEQARTETT